VDATQDKPSASVTHEGAAESLRPSGVHEEIRTATVPLSGSGKPKLKGLNELRAIAALAVLYFHVRVSFLEMRVSDRGFLKLGNSGVLLFYVMSGFLITYLLLQEKRDKLRVDIVKFYMRRILRIWPLYFFYLIAVVVAAESGLIKVEYQRESLIYFLLFAANVPFWLGGRFLPELGHYWSLGVEEQFYLFWPWIVRKSRNVLRAILVLFVAWFAFKVLARGREIVLHADDTRLYRFFNVFCFHTMALGGMAACVLFEARTKVLALARHRLTQALAWTVYGLTAFNLIGSVCPAVIFSEVFGLSTAVVILNAVSNPKPLIPISNRWLDFIGQISFGVYVYHPLVIQLVKTYAKPLFLFAPVANYLLATALVLVATLAIAYVSFEYLEKPFLALKDAYTPARARGARMPRPVGSSSGGQ
jgi:peptidoglycan/LPS O-acetylase OafA/YrhL